MIVKDELIGETDLCDACEGDEEVDDEDCKVCEGTWGYDEVSYISFEAENHPFDPIPLKGGEYDKKSIMNKKELEKYTYLFNEGKIEISDCKYQEFYFIRESKYDPKQWTKSWLELDNKRNL